MSEEKTFHRKKKEILNDIKKEFGVPKLLLMESCKRKESDYKIIKETEEKVKEYCNKKIEEYYNNIDNN